MKKILSNLGLLVLGFGAWVVFDYFYAEADAPLDPGGLWWKSQFLGLLFPVVVFVVNWHGWRSVSLPTRTLVCMGVAVGLSVLELGLIFYIGFPIHLNFGGYE